MAIVQREAVQVRRGGVINEHKFSIASTPDSFRILSDGLYSDKIRAIVRELSTNAIDSQVEAGNGNKPFYVHLPNIIEPYFQIRDYGTGMSPEKLEELYVTYFWSDKKETNEQVGQLGLGSKSPFAYTDAFTVVSYHNGKKYTYSAFISEGTEDKYDPDTLEVIERGEQGGFPAIALLGEDDTDEPNGIEITVPVSQSDFDRFREKAEQVYQYFKIQPKVEGSRYYDVPKLEYPHMQGEGWGIHTLDGKPKAIMGNIAYPIQFADESQLTPEQQELLNTGVDMYFNIGELDITPSRELLQNNGRTVAALMRRFEQIIQHVREHISKEFDSIEHLWDAKCTFYDLFGRSASKNKLARIAGMTKLQWRGQEIGDTQIYVGDLKGVEAQHFFKYKRYYWRDDSKLKRERVNYITANKNLGIFESDLTRGSFTRCQRAIEDGKYDAIILVTFKTDEDRKAFRDKLGIADKHIGKTSELPKYASNSAAARTYSRVFEFDPKVTSYYSDNKEYWKPVEIDIVEGGVYVEMYKNDVRINGQIESVVNLKTAVQHLGKLGDDVEIIGFRAPVKKKVLKSEDWVNIWDHVREFLSNQIDDELEQHIVNVRQTQHNREFEMALTLAEEFKKLHNGQLPDTPFGRFVEKVLKLQESVVAVPEYEHYSYLISTVGYKLTKEATYNFHREFRTILNEYPMLSYFEDSVHYSPAENQVKDFLGYVNTVDKA